MKVGILGTGEVGQALARGFSSSGHSVVIGSRDAKNPKSAEFVRSLGPNARAGSFADAASSGEVVVLATLGLSTFDALQLAGTAALDGKVVIDVTNPLVFSEDGPHLAMGHTDSQGERVQGWLPKARVVKTLNIVGNPSMFRPEYPGGPPDMWLCGNDAGAKDTVTRLLHDLGWPSVIDIGGIEGARLLEPLCILWVRSGAALGNFNIAFRLLRK
ncbi:MAG: NAD(P)-binding domain-containing protein [Thermoplasmata archaeon]|nr:NAD(P)-binding domain-containing protein [Thermoplasmata archaeon]